ncbi:hypothetical protein D9M69_334900 [compost metagenome]
MVDEGVEEHRPRGLRCTLATAVVDVVEQPMLVFQFKVVPVLAAHKHAGIAVPQFEVMQALEDLREGLALLEIQTTVIAGGARRRTALAHGVVRRNVIRIGTAHGPAGPHRERRIELAFDLADIEFDGTRLGTDTQGNGGSQQTRLERDAHHCSCHAALRHTSKR